MKYKIVHIITRLDKGGSSENVLLTVTYFAQKGYRCSLIYGKTVDPPLELIRKAKTAGVEFIPVTSLVRSINPLCDFLAFLRLLRFLRFLRPSIVHTHSSKAGILGRWSTWLSRYLISDIRYPMIVHTPHGHVFYGYYGKMITAIFIMVEKITAMITDKLIALTEGEKNESLAFGVGKSEQWEVIHSGVDFLNSKLKIKNEKLLRELNIPEKAIVIGTVGRLDPVKGYQYFVEAMNIVTSYKLQVTGEIKFLIVGDGEERKSLEFRVSDLGIEDRVIFTGWKDDVEEMISLMDIYVQPSVNEGMGKTLIQAQALGKPIVATNVQGIPSVVEDDITGILVPAKDSQALAEAILRLAQDKELRRKMGEEGKKWVSASGGDGYARFGTERMIYLIEKLYEKLLEGAKVC